MKKFTMALVVTMIAMTIATIYVCTVIGTDDDDEM